MQLQDICIEKNFAWESRLGKAYHYEDEEGNAKTVFRYQIPFSPDKEAMFLSQYNVALADRMKFYQTLVRCIQRQVNVSEHLSSLGVPSILCFSRTEQEQAENGLVSIYLETEQVWPIMDQLLTNEVPSLTLLDVVSRLSIILRDIYKAPACVAHRGLDLNEVYINGSNRILLGGFFYASCEALGPYPEYLPCRPPHIPYQLAHGGPGSHKTDIQTLSFTAWNLFSGIPHDANWATKRMPLPEFASAELVEALLLGMAGEDEVCNLFRRKLTDYRKLLLKESKYQRLIPIRKPLLKDISITWVTTAPEGAEKDTNSEKGGKTHEHQELR